MQFLGTLFIIFFIVWLIGKILSRYWPYLAMWLLKRQVRRQMDQAFGPGAPRENRQREYDPFGHFRRKRKEADRRHQRRSRKIIDPSVGEYVEFEEVRTYSSQTPPEPPAFKPEPQIEDAEWEEIK